MSEVPAASRPGRFSLPKKTRDLLILALSLMAFGVLGLLIRPQGEPDQVLDNRFGDVLWNHGLHARLPHLNCTSCHHNERAGTQNPKPCRQCHQLPAGSDALILKEVPAREAFHANCRGCHQAANQGPVGCRDCHAQNFSGDHGRVRWNHLQHSRRMPGLSCPDCHHATEDYRPQNESEYRGCGQCHPRLTVRPQPAAPIAEEHDGAVHGRCAFCHPESNPEEGVSDCASCHPDLAGQEGRDRPVSAEQAVHRKCLGCHNQNNPDLAEGMPALCEDCHRPSPSVLAGWKAGKVLWSHTRHLPDFNGRQWECDTCHHKDREGTPQLACRVCHGAGVYSLPDKTMPTLTRAYAKRCLACHKEKKSGPLRFEVFAVAQVPGALASEAAGRKILWDHRLHADSLAFSCGECHHNTRVKDGALIICPSAVSCPEEEGVGAPQACRKCHGEAGPVPGSLADKPEYRAPPLVEAFTRPCLECHHRLEAGPRAWEELVEK